MAPRINSRSHSYRIARALQRCVRCAQLTPVVGLLLPVGHETLGGDVEAGRAPHDWEVSESEALLFFVGYVPEQVQVRLRQLAPHYRWDHEDAAAPWYWMNHCSRCRMKQDDTELYCEPESAFAPVCAAAAASICLHLIREPLEALAAGYAYAPPYFAYAQR
jgi:hypothetical protein